MDAHAVDPGKVFVAGLSAGAAMAAILGARYPDVFSGVAVHSGLAVGSAHDMPSAFAAMSQGGTRRERSSVVPVRTIVIHGDADTTVSSRNGDRITEQVLAGRSLRPSTLSARDGDGRRSTRTTYHDELGQVWVEHWVLHGAGHAWSGGDTAGSFTDARGPDASREIVRFFFETE
jgi:poly(3-hydroxybutyrate) depolymerase